MLFTQERKEGHPDILGTKCMIRPSRSTAYVRVCPCEWHISVLFYCCIVLSSCTTSEGVCVCVNA